MEQTKEKVCLDTAKKNFPIILHSPLMNSEILSL